MTTPQGQAGSTPSISTAPPPRTRWRFGNVPARLGRARTSTLVLVLLWVAFFTLWVFVRPETTAGAATGNDPGTVEAPAPASTTRAPATTPEPVPTSEPTESSTPGTTTPSTTSAEPTGSAPSATPTTPPSGSVGLSPTTVAPTTPPPDTPTG